MKSLLRVFGVLLMVLAIVGVACPSQALALAHTISPEHGQHVLTSLLGIGGPSSLACIIAPIDSIELDECPNAGGLTDLYVIRRRDIDSFPDPDADGVTISKPIVPKQGAGFAHWAFAADSGEVNHSSSGDIGNQSVKHEVNVYNPRGAAATDAVIQTAINGDFVVIGRDSNGNYRIAGDKHRGVGFTHDYKSGKKGTDKNGTDLKMAGEGFTHVPFYYTAALPLKV